MRQTALKRLRYDAYERGATRNDEETASTQDARGRSKSTNTRNPKIKRNEKRQAPSWPDLRATCSPPSAKAPRAKSQGLSAKRPPRAKSQERTRREEREARAISTGTYIAVSSRLSTQVNQPGSPSSRAKKRPNVQQQQLPLLRFSAQAQALCFSTVAFSC